MWLSRAMRRPVPLACSTTALAALLLGAGVSGGDTVRIGAVELEWEDEA